MRLPTCLSVPALAAAFTLGQAAAPVPELVSRRAAGLGPAVTGNGPSHDAGFAGGGRFVVFTSGAAGLVADDANGPRLDVFRRDLAAGVTELVSLGPDGQPWGDAEAFGQSVSADGTKVAFVRQTLRPAAGSSLLASDVYVRDLTAGTTTLVSARADGPGPGNGASGNGVISADGRFVAFESAATDLAGGADANGATDVFLRDLTAGTTQRLSNRAGSGDAGNGLAHSPQVSADGAVVVFHSSASDLVAGVSGILTDLHIWRRADGSLARVVLPGPMPAPNRLPVRIYNVALSGDGQHLAFRAPNDTGANFGGVWWLDLETETQTRVVTSTLVDPAPSYNGSGPVMSGDGRTLAFTVGVTNDTVAGERIKLWNADTGLHTLDELVVTLPPTGGEPLTSEWPVLSADATKLAFLSASPVPGTAVAEAGEHRWFVRTLATAATVALPDGEGEPRPALAFPEFSPAGDRLLFSTDARLGDFEDGNDTFDVFVADLASGSLSLASTVSQDQASRSPRGFSSLNLVSANDGSAVSADGRYVLFVSDADDVAPGDTNRIRDVFRYDRKTGATTTVTALSDGVLRGGTPWDFTPDGRLVLFASDSTDYAEGDTNALTDIFLKDMETGVVTLVSAKDGHPPASGDGPALTAVMSADGRYVAFGSRAGDLVAGGATLSGRANVFLRDTQLGRTTLVSVDDSAAGITGVQNQVFHQPLMSEDGATIVFGSGSTRRLWGYNRLTGNLTSLSDEPQVSRPMLSRSGRWLAYGASGFGVEKLVLVDLTTGVRRFVSLAGQISINEWQLADNGAVVFTSRLPHDGERDRNDLRDVYFYDPAAGQVRLVSQSSDGTAGLGGPSDKPGLSLDGRLVVFRSWATNLVAEDGNGTSDVFLHDTLTGQTTLLNADPQTGRSVEGWSSVPAISADGRVAVFTSVAHGLSAEDLNGTGDVFAVALPAVPAPLVLTQVAAGQGGARIRFQWVGNPGVRYAVRVTGNLDGPWETVGGELLGTGEPLSFEEPEAGAPPNDTGRYFQVIELP